jgi:PAS domain S-box-containing protein
MTSSLEMVLATHDATLVDRVKEDLEPHGWTTIVTDGTHIHRLLANNRTRLFMVDTRSGSLTTKAICATIRSSSTMPVGIIALVDGYADNLDELLEASVDDILIDPFTVFSLLARIHSQMKRITTAEQLEFKIRDSWTLIEITSKLVGTGDLLYSLFDMVTILSRELNATRGSVVLVRQEGDLGLVIASSDNSEIQDLVIQLEAYPEIRKVVETGKPLIVTDISESMVLKDVLPTLQSKQVHSIALFPITEKDCVLGVIFLRYAQSRSDFHQRELVFCQTVANATAIALRNHEIMESLRRKDRQIARVRERAQSQLAAIEPYEKFFMGSMDGLIVLSDSGVVVFVNPVGSQLFGLPQDRIKGIPFIVLLPEDQAPAYHLLIEQSEQGTPGTRDFIIFHEADIEENQRILSISARLLGSGGMTLLAIRDVTQERLTARRLVEATEQLIQSEKQSAMMELAGAAAHELNQPMTFILTSMAIFRKLIQQEKDLPLSLLDTLEAEVDRMTEIIRKLSSLTEYSTRPYVGDAHIVDLEQTGATRKNTENQK